MSFDNTSAKYHDFLDNPTPLEFEFELVSETTVVNIINSLKNKHTKDHDQITNKLIKIIKTEIAKPLTYIINQSITSGCFPERLKLARVRPLYKKGDRQLITNYRPISILPIISKIFERVLHMQITYYLEDNKLLSKAQYGYRKGHST